MYEMLLEFSLASILYVGFTDLFVGMRREANELPAFGDIRQLRLVTTRAVRFKKCTFRVFVVAKYALILYFIEYVFLFPCESP